MGTVAWVLIEMLRVLAWEGHQRPDELVIRTKDDLARVWANDGRKDFPPPVDFEKEMVIAVFSGEKSAGHKIEIQVVVREPEGKKGLVLFKETRPDSNTKPTSRKAYPSHVMVVRKAADVEFKFVDVESDEGKKFLEAQKKAR